MKIRSFSYLISFSSTKNLSTNTGSKISFVLKLEPDQKICALLRVFPKAITCWNFFYYFWSFFGIASAVEKIIKLIVLKKIMEQTSWCQYMITIYIYWNFVRKIELWYFLTYEKNLPRPSEKFEDANFTLTIDFNLYLFPFLIFDNFLIFLQPISKTLKSNNEILFQ